MGDYFQSWISTLQHFSGLNGLETQSIYTVYRHTLFALKLYMWCAVVLWEAKKHMLHEVEVACEDNTLLLVMTLGFGT